MPMTTLRCSSLWLQLHVLQLLFTTSPASHSTSCDAHRRSHSKSYYYSGSSDDEPEELDDSNIQTAVNQWVVNRSGAEIRFGNIEDWDTSRVTHMWNLFRDKMTFNDDISEWNTACVTTMHGMFWGANAFNQDIGNWDTGNVENMHSMFRNAFDFNQDLHWDTSNVEDMSHMFDRALSFEGDLSHLDVSNVFSMEGMFRESIYNEDISMWDVGDLVVATSMFEGNKVFNSNIKHWEPKSLVLFERMFYNATSFEQKLCWKLDKDQSTKSFQVFCFSWGKFDPDCVDKHVIRDAERKCVGAIQSWLQSWIDFADEFLLALQDFYDFFRTCFPFLPELNITDVCFSPDAMTPVEDRGMVPMRDLRVGDRVLTGCGQYQPVYSIIHADKSKPTPYIQIHTSHSDNHTSVRPLELTPNHMLYVVGYDNPIPAWQVEVGDFLYVMKAGGQASGGWPSWSPATRKSYGNITRIVEIKEIIRNGLYNPLTEDGTIVVDDIVASAYAAFLGSEHIQLFREFRGTNSVTGAKGGNVTDGWKVMSHQTFLHLLLSPYRAICLYSPFPLCNTTQEGAEETEYLHPYLLLGQHLMVFWLKQNGVVQALIFVALVVVFGFLNMILNPLGFSAAVGFLCSKVLRTKKSHDEPPRQLRKEKIC